MGVSLDVYRAAIGTFNFFKLFVIVNVNFSDYDLLFIVSDLIIMLFIACILIILSNDVQLNPGPVQLFKIGQLNARSLNSSDKFEEISYLIRENDFDIFAITETWLNEHISSDCLAISGYNNIIRLDREGRIGGGVAIYTSDSLVVKRRSDLEIVGIELLWIEFRLNQNNFLCCTGYRPPCNDANSINAFFRNFQITLDKIRDQFSDFKIIIMGDFNAHYNVDYPQESTDIGTQFHSFLEGNNLTQMITEPTRVTNRCSSILDLIITNYPVFFTNTGTLSPSSNCDHSVVFAKMNIQIFKCYAYKREVWNFNNVNFSALNKELLENNWYSLFDSAFDIDVVYNTWFSHFRTTIEKYIPLLLGQGINLG
jgi:exonuclease III